MKETHNLAVASRGSISLDFSTKKPRPRLMNCLRNTLRNPDSTFKKTSSTFKKIVSPSGMSITGHQASDFIHSGNTSNRFVKSRASNGVDTRVESGITIEAENNQQRQLYDASDAAYEDSLSSLSTNLSPIAKKRPRSKIYWDPVLEPRQNQLPGQVESFCDMDYATQAVESFSSTPCSVLNSTKQDSTFPFGSQYYTRDLIPDNGSVEGYGTSRRKVRIDLRTRFEPMSNAQPLMDSFHEDDDPLKPESDRQYNKHSLCRNGKHIRPSFPRRTSLEARIGAKRSGDNKPFDICIGRRKNRAALPFDNELESIEFDHFVDGNVKILMPGMVILKRYIPLNLQVNIALRCREIGLGKGGFYQPGYKDGPKLRLQMMCLGLDWDPQTRRYSKIRNYDNTEPPDIPQDFSLLVGKALDDSRSVVKQQSSSDNVEEAVPIMNPDICIANFYTSSGRLGLHQDRDESKESITRGLPVVSFSIGDSAEFLYGEKRDVDKAEKVLLESGDMLIFGGNSRLIFQGWPRFYRKQLQRNWWNRQSCVLAVSTSLSESINHKIFAQNVKLRLLFPPICCVSCKAGPKPGKMMMIRSLFHSML